MVSKSDIAFYTGLTVSDADAETYTSLAVAHLNMDGGGELPEPVKTEALCYFIASRISAKSETGGAVLGESIGGYSYTAKQSTSPAGNWYDLYKELLGNSSIGRSGSAAYNGGKGVKRVDANVLHIQRRYK